MLEKSSVVLERFSHLLLALIIFPFALIFHLSREAAFYTIGYLKGLRDVVTGAIYKE